jgi:uncharacterized repeat protein (TIGR03803 family)
MKGVSYHARIRYRHAPLGALCAAAMFLFAVVAAPAAQAQTYTIIHDFTGGGDGGNPFTGLTIDAAGSLYGTTTAGGNHGAGVIFKLKHGGSGWRFTPIYTFTGGSDGAGSQGRVAIAADGTLYGSTGSGGLRRCSGVGCGTVFHLRPPAFAPRSALTPWTQNVIYSFSGTDGYIPQGDLTFDASGNIYGTTVGGGAFNWGAIYKLTPSGGGWTESVLYSAQEDNNGFEPYGGVVRDASGNLYGVFQFSSGGSGAVFQLTPSGSAWTEQTIHNFNFSGDNGVEPIGGLIMDASGNLYGTTLYGGTFPAGGTAFELTPGGGGWSYQTIHSFQNGDGGPEDKLMMDATGNLYGTAFSAGAFGWGSVFKLTPSIGGWTMTTLHDFCADDFPCRDGARPMSNVVMDAQGSLYGTTTGGGAYAFGVVWKITP